MLGWHFRRFIDALHEALFPPPWEVKLVDTRQIPGDHGEVRFRVHVEVRHREHHGSCWRSGTGFAAFPSEELVYDGSVELAAEQAHMDALIQAGVPRMAAKELAKRRRR